jgi:hypothetical protein
MHYEKEMAIFKTVLTTTGKSSRREGAVWRAAPMAGRVLQMSAVAGKLAALKKKEKRIKITADVDSNWKGKTNRGNLI